MDPSAVVHVLTQFRAPPDVTEFRFRLAAHLRLPEEKVREQVFAMLRDGHLKLTSTRRLYR